ncbi:hypothetical protein BFP76_06480 [Amylibacter kogurei]|uniref:Multidrug-efflux transporter n=1 Tax=Paramylibacter kogurei TaxID=1889778 RepID=A0A2G5K6F6_9RHOB|nr:hypothetical protein BFP76_06480 [Amylibacter kogurei]
MQSWSSHVRSTLALGTPLVGSHLAQMLIQTTDVVMLGWYGVEELAGTILATQVFILVLLIGSGFAFAVMPMAANAIAAGRDSEVRQSVRMAALIALVYSMLAIIPLSFLEKFLLLTGQQPELAHIAGQYMSIAQWALIPGALVFVTRSFFSALERTQVVFWVVVLGAIWNAVLNYVFIFGNFGMPELGARGAAISSVMTTSATLVAFLCYAYWRDEIRGYLFYRGFFQIDFHRLKEVFSLGWPISLSMLAETGLFTASTLMVGAFGTLALATHGIVLQIVTIFFMIPLGMSNAATVRAARFWGRSENNELRRASFVAVILAVAIAVVTMVLYLVLPDRLIPLFLDREETRVVEIVALGSTLLVVAAMFQIVDALQLVMSALLRGLKDTLIPMMIAVVSFWFVGLPTSYFLGFTFGLGATGVWWGLVFGLGLAAILLGLRLRVLLNAQPAMVPNN